MSGDALPAECDVVVIGAGIGGLSSAALLAKAGLRVCVVEAEARPGGYLAGFRRGEFRFDTAIHWLNQCGPTGFVRRFFDLLGPGAPTTAPQRRIRRYKGDSFDYLLTDQPDDLRDAWLREFPRDAEGIKAFFSAARTVGASLDTFSALVREPTMSLSERARMHLRLLPTGLRMLSYLGKTADKGLSKFFENDKLRRVFCSEESLISVLAPIGWAYVGDFQLPPPGGSQAFPEWLCGLLRGWGGTISYGCRVSHIMVEGKRAVGVRLSRGRHHPVSATIRAKYVVAACDLTALYEKMLPPELVKREWVEHVRGADVYDSSVTLSIGLNVPPRDLGLDEELIFLSRDGLSCEENNSGDPHKAGISILAPSLRDPTLAPAGKGTLTVYAQARLEYGDNWKTEAGLGRGDAYKAFKKSYADVLLDRVSAAVAPGLRKHIAFCDIATPVTHQRYTGNRGGTIMGQRPSGKNILRGLARYKTPLNNLFVGGHWAEYGGGVPIAVRAGMNSALMVLERERPAAFRAVCDMLDGRLLAGERLSL